ncbi:unnamed protein product [Paramecium octaurelia]|uniref:Uncharacterized protein n=1 Tax=Paramecium octaurelia TaxID=43137 RepID=A0A8S1TZR7_PAROT|nr:unnamed protein product [Paramecium octaurelia]
MISRNMRLNWRLDHNYITQKINREPHINLHKNCHFIQTLYCLEPILFYSIKRILLKSAHTLIKNMRQMQIEDRNTSYLRSIWDKS